MSLPLRGMTLALGASGVQIGTAYVLCHEATTSAVHRAALQSEPRPGAGPELE